MLKKILVVDDDQDIVFMIKSVLEKDGYGVATAHDGTEALKAVESGIFDLVIADLTMPGMDGWRLSMKLRQDERYKHIPIIILSGLLNSEESQPEAFETADVYMAKPFDIFKLMDKVKELLELKRA